MKKPDWRRPKNTQKSEKRASPKAPPSRFAPSAFLSGSPESVQRLCEELAAEAARRFQDLTGTSWREVGVSLAEKLRALGHDLHNFDENEGFQDWQATWHHPRGTFMLLLAFRAPAGVEVTWKTDEATFSARA